MSGNKDIDQLLSDPDFRRWISHPTDELDTYWHSWLLSRPGQEDNFYLAKDIAESLLSDSISIPDESVAYNVEGILDKTTRRRSVLPASYNWLTIAATIVLVVGLALYYSKVADNRKIGTTSAQASVRLLEFSNNGKRSGHITLPDGSTVIVLPHSKITYPETFSDTIRNVTLVGEAFFEVTKDPERPFIVSSHHLKTRVLGTSFRIRDVEDKAPLVRVKTGTVTVNFEPLADSNKERVTSSLKELVLQAHQEMKFVGDVTNLQPTLSTPIDATADNLPIETNTFSYRRTLVSEVFETLKNAYDVDIKYDADKLKNCTLTARLGDQPLMEKLRMVCLGLNLQFFIDKNGVVTISGDGCN
ncbi:MAG TPA: FecR family protein [Dyadobacter sp.]|nr:FecR family protein [Dyadobacter sp.]